MRKEDFILPEPLRQERPTGVLDTWKKVQEASAELHKATGPAFEAFRVSKRKSLEEAMRRILD